MIVELLANTFPGFVVSGISAANLIALRRDHSTAGYGPAPCYSLERKRGEKSPASEAKRSQFGLLFARRGARYSGISPADACIPVRCRHVRLPVVYRGVKNTIRRRRSTWSPSSS